jgi:type II secretory pathway pseudopilin PulG
MIRKRSNFTLVEIIAVLLLIAILAAVAAPKFINMADEAKKGAAQAGINEAKSSLNLSYHKEYLVAKGQPTTASVVNAVFGADDGGSIELGDITVDASVSGDVVSLTAALTTELGTDETAADVDSAIQATGTWNLPSN